MPQKDHKFSKGFFPVPALLGAAGIRDLLPVQLAVKELIVPLKYIEYGLYGDLIIVYPKPYSIYLSGTKNKSSSSFATQ